MSEAQTLSYTQTQVAERLRTYKLLFGISLIIDAVIGLYAVVDPVGLARLLTAPDPDPDVWARIWGATFAGLQLVYVPGVQKPLFYRWPNWSSIGIKLFMAIVLGCAGAHFRPLAAWELLWSVILFLTYYQLTLSDLRGHA
jgi:hypothetical protein